MTRSSSRRRRTVAVLGPLLAVVLAACASSEPGAEPSLPRATQTSPLPAAADASAEFEGLESRFDARLGLYAVDTGTEAEVAWRDDERFAYASTIKAFVAAVLLDQVGVDGLGQGVAVESVDILPNSPVTETRVGGTMTVGELAEAAVTQSDNAATNYLFEVLGGVEALGEALSDLGDDVTTVSRTEPDLNAGEPGDERDTTTPRAVAGTLREYVLGDALDDAEQAVLTGWLTGTQTGDTLVRADLPPDWTVGDKSGAGGYGSRGDIAVVWPTEGAPIVIAVLSSRDDPDAEYDDRLVAEAAATAVAALRP